MALLENLRENWAKYDGFESISIGDKCASLRRQITEMIIEEMYGAASRGHKCLQVKDVPDWFAPALADWSVERRLGYVRKGSVVTISWSD